MFTRFLSRARRGAAPERPTPRPCPLGVEALEARDVPAIVYGLTAAGALVQFDSTNPGAIISAVNISGLQTAGEQVLGIDFRPLTGQLYAVTVPTGTTSGGTLRTYTIDPTTGAATLVGATSAIANAADVATGIDFNPTTDRIRVVQANNENGRIGPTFGGGTDDTDLTFSGATTGPIGSVAYDRNFARSVFSGIPTTLYGIDTAVSELVVIGGINGSAFGGPSGGAVSAVGLLGVTLDASSFVGLDIGRSTANNGLGSALASLTVGGATALYSIDLASGAATLIGNIGDALTQYRDLAISPPVVVPALVVGSGPGAAGDVRILNRTTGAITAGFQPFAGFAGGVRVAAGDVNADGVTDVVASAIAPQGHTKVFDGATGAEIYSFFAYPGFVGTVNVGAGDVNGDGFIDVLTVANGGQGHVKAFSGRTGALLASFFAFPGYGGDVTIAAGDFDNDGNAEIVVGAAANGHVKVFNTNGALYSAPGIGPYSFITFTGFSGGISVAAGDLTGDNRADLVVASGTGSPGHVKVFNGVTGTTLASFFAYTGRFFGGVSVALADANGDNRPDIRVTPGPGVPADVLSFDLFGNPVGTVFPAFAGFFGGATVAAPPT